MTTQLTITTPDDMHVHLREGADARAFAACTLQQFGRAMVMPNLSSPVRTSAQAKQYRDALLQGGLDFVPLMTLYLTESTTARELEAAAESGIVHGVKCYPAGATTNSAAGVRSLANCGSALDAMAALQIPLLVHGEVLGADVFDREREFLTRELDPLRRRFPKLRVVLEHITTEDAVTYVQNADDLLAATVTAHHLLYNRNAMFDGGLRPHAYCLPVLKRERHRQALLAAVASGNSKFFLGSDSAPHLRERKEAACGCAGAFTAPNALELYAQAFEEAGALGKLDAFASVHGASYYRLPRNQGTVTLVREPKVVPTQMRFPSGDVVPLCAGETLNWTARPRATGADVTG
jgi:dihydroorotase